MTDITSHRQLEATLRRSEQRFRQLFDSSSDAIMTLEPPSWQFSTANQATIVMFGVRDVEQFLELGPGEVSPELQPDGRVSTEKSQEMIETALRVGSHYFKWTHRRISGELFPATVRLSRMETDGQIFLQATVRDITEHQQAEDRLRASEAKYRTLVETTHTGYLILDEEGNVIDANPEYLRLTGRRDFSEIYGRSVIEWTAEYEKEKNARAVHQCTRDGYINDLIVDYIDTTGHITPVEINASLVNDVAGIRIIALCRDITERVRTEEAIRAKNEELEQFVYTVSHDLRSPVVTLQTFLGHLEQDIPANNARRMATDFEYLHAAANKMAQLLDELLKLSRIGHATNPSVDVLLQDVVMEALELVAGRMAPLGVQVTVTADPIILCGDRARFVGLFQNLLDNACKFMGDQPAPRIEIGVETREAKTVFFVRDNGDGIDPRHQVKVFGLFEKLDPHADGTGMGLALVKRIVELHDGRIWVESLGFGQGACFYFTLPGATLPLHPTEGE